MYFQNYREPGLKHHLTKAPKLSHRAHNCLQSQMNNQVISTGSKEFQGVTRYLRQEGLQGPIVQPLQSVDEETGQE